MSKSSIEAGLVTLLDLDWLFAEERTRSQESRYGRNSGYFHLEQDKANTFTGVLGELAVRRHLIERFGLRDADVRLTDVGSTYDLVVRSSPIIQLHVKTGLWGHWPSASTAFGVHAGQGLESTSGCLVLVSLRRSGDQVDQRAKVEGFISPRQLGECPVIREGETFPGTRYPSRTDNRLTYIRQYAAIRRLEDLIVDQ